MSIMSKWSVVTEHAVGPEDLGADATITDAAVDRWAAAATAAYLEQCARLEDRRATDGLVVRSSVREHGGARQLGGAPTVVVTATATEVLPEAFVVAVRIRPLAADSDDPLDLACEIRLEDPVTGAAQDIGRDIRDELIALEHGARHYN